MLIIVGSQGLNVGATCVSFELDLNIVNENLAG